MCISVGNKQVTSSLGSAGGIPGCRSLYHEVDEIMKQGKLWKITDPYLFWLALFEQPFEGKYAAFCITFERTQKLLYKAAPPTIETLDAIASKADKVSITYPIEVVNPPDLVQVFNMMVSNAFNFSSMDMHLVSHGVCYHLQGKRQELRLVDITESNLPYNDLKPSFEAYISQCPYIKLVR